MFEEIDTDKNGYLTFDEFQKLLSKLELGISHNELGLLINEADDDHNGVVDYKEFVPLAVDMIIAFRARKIAVSVTSQQESQADKIVMDSMHSQELKQICDICMMKFRALDEKKSGYIKMSEFRKILVNVRALGVSELDISKICQLIPRYVHIYVYLGLFIFIYIWI
jgi:Ca2+-binding EF-hand superfamily protein